MVNLLEKSTSTHKVKNTEVSLSPSAILSEEYMQAKEKPSDPVPRSKNPSSASGQTIDICHSIQIKSGSLWQIIFNMRGGENVKLSLNKQGVHRILSTLISQAERANWSISVKAKWLNMKSS